MTSPVTLDPAIHTRAPTTALSSKTQAVDLLKTLLANLPELILQGVVAFIKAETGVDLSGLLKLLQPLFDAFQGVDLTNPGSVLTVIEKVSGTLIQSVIDSLGSGLTGSSVTGLDPASIGLALINDGLAIPTQLFDQFAAQLAALTGQVTAIQNNPTGAIQTDDFGIAGLSAWTANVLNTLLVVGGLIRTPIISAGYVGTPGTPRKPNTDRHGIQIVVDGKQRGGVRAFICSDATMSNYCAVDLYSGFQGDAARIVTGSSPSLTAVQKQTDFIDAPAIGPSKSMSGTSRVQALTAFDIRYDPAANTFTVLRNGVPAVSWPDSTNIVTHGSGKRLVGVVSNVFSGSVIDSSGFGIKKVTFYDW